MLALELVSGRAQRHLAEDPARGVHRAVAGRGDRAGAGGGGSVRLAFGPLHCAWAIAEAANPRAEAGLD